MIGVLAQTGVTAGDVIDPIVFAGIAGVIAVTLIGIITVLAGYLQGSRALSTVANTNTVQTVDRAQEDEKGGN
jgi:F0F1-type ATP synthase assembly protein I